MSRQTKAFEEFRENFTKLLMIDNKIGPEQRRDLQAEMEDFWNHPGIQKNMEQAFSNFMWHMDQQIEEGVNEEIGRLIELIPLIADPADPNTLTILAQLKEIVESNSKPLEEMDDEEIDALVTDDETDDSRPPGL